MNELRSPLQHSRRRGRALLCAALSIAALLLAGCGDSNPFKPKKKLPPEPKPAPAPPRDPLLVDTLGYSGTLSDLGIMKVRGFSLVVGLGENGSADCPTVIRDYLIDTMTKNFGPSTGPEGQRFSAAKLIDSHDSAVVEVIGVIRAGAVRGDAFDVRVDALPGTDTRSIEGGLLLPCELRLYDVSASGESMVTGRVVGRAQGPIAVNPFATGKEGTATADPRRGFVLNGGIANEPRPARLVFREASYALARRIENRINERFGQSPRAAEAFSKGYVQLNTPAEFAINPARYHALVTALLNDDAPTFVERKLADLTQMATEPGADLERISAMWEGIGRTATPRISPLYNNETPAVAFAAARAGLRVKDVNAIPVLGLMAATPKHPYRLQATRELGLTELPQAAPKLAALIDADDDEIRVAAYEGLLQHRHASVKSKLFVHPLDIEQVNVVLDVVNAAGKPLVYVRRTMSPRIAVFGPNTPLLTPLLYTDEKTGITLNAPAPTDELTISVRDRYGKKINDRTYTRARVVDVITALAELPQRNDAKQLRGAGLTYSQVVGVLKALSDMQALPGRLMLEQESLTELLGPEEDVRPEGDPRTKDIHDTTSQPAEETPANAPAPTDSEAVRPEGG